MRPPTVGSLIYLPDLRAHESVFEYVNISVASLDLKPIFRSGALLPFFTESRTSNTLLEVFKHYLLIYVRLFNFIVFDFRVLTLLGQGLARFRGFNNFFRFCDLSQFLGDNRGSLC